MSGVTRGRSTSEDGGAVDDAARRDRVARVTTAVRAHWDDLESRLAERADDGLALGRARAAALEAMLASLWDEAVAAAEARPRDGIALCAVGTFGRGAVALRSDIDVRLLVPERAKSREAASRVADALLYPLWDAGLSVGHQVVDVGEAIALAQEDLATATSLLDMRLVGGDASTLAELEERAYGGIFSEGELAHFVARLEEEVAGRHKRFGGSVYLLEPEVKTGPGGLRDLDVARWAARARYRTTKDGDTWRDLVRLGVLVPREAHEITRAEEFLWRIRNRLHAHAKRKSDRLTFDQQESIAEDLGFGAARRASAPPMKVATDAEIPGGESRAFAAERFMQDYFGHARVVSRAREAILVRVIPPRRRGKPVEVDLGDGLRLFDGQVNVDPSKLASDPSLALRAYGACVQKNARILPFARDAIASAAADEGWCARLRASPDAAKLFVDLLCTVPDAPVRRGSMANELHEVGLLLAMIPEFRPVTGRVHHDVYHVYTVDVHSVAAVDCLRALCRGDLAQERSLGCRLAAEMARPVPLFLATLLHDVGKGYPDESGSRKNHSIVGADIAKTILPRLGIAGEDAEDVCALVKNHLLMYHVATRRDLDDPSTTAEFCKQVQGREGLRDLYLLTVADITTTSPTAMTSWKARMLDELYFTADASFAGAVDTWDEERRKRIRDSARALWSGEPRPLDAFVASMPERYLLANAPEAIVAHARIAEARRREGKAVLSSIVPSRHPEVSEICVVADDAPGLLARIAAAITSNRLEVLGAQVYSRTRDGDAKKEAVDLFWVRDARAGRSEGGVAEAMPRLGRDLESLCTGETTAEELLRERIGTASPWRERPSPAVLSEVVVDDRASPGHTVIEVFAKDRPGLLYSLAKELHSLGLGIALSKINTEGTKVADVFYVNELGGSKVAPGPRFKAIREALLASLTTTD